MRLVILGLLIGLSCTTKGDSDNGQIEKQIKGFLNWYSQKWDTLNVDLLNPIIENSMLDKPDSTRPYKVNFENAEIYFNQFRQSGYMSEAYIKSFTNYFKTCQLEFEKSPQYFGPPNGFEFDFVFRSQTADFERKNPDKVKVTDISVSKDKAKATVKFFDTYFYYYQLTKINGTWLIDDIKASYEK